MTEADTCRKYIVPKAVFHEIEWRVAAPFQHGEWKGSRVYLTPHFVPYAMGKARVVQLCRLIRDHEK